MSGPIVGEMTPTQGAGQTSGTSTLTLLSIPIPTSGKAYRLEARLVGVDAGNGNAVSLAKSAVVRTASSVASLAGSVLDLLGALGDLALTGASSTIAVSGSTVEVRVTGVLGRTINWTAELAVWST